VIEPEADVREAAKHVLYTEVSRLFVEDRGRLVGYSADGYRHALSNGRIQRGMDRRG
jgi:hypothetical protein